MQKRIDVNWVQTLAGGLAAMSSAVLMSTVGVAGTIVGAALGSIAITVGSAVYSHYLTLSRERVAAARVAALQRAYRPRVMARAGAGLSDAGTDTVVDLPVLGDDPVTARRIRWLEVAGGLGWKRIGAAAMATFLLVMSVILAFEISSGRSVSSYTGGSDAGARTSLSLFGGNSGAGSSTGDAGSHDAGTRSARPDADPAGLTAERGQGDVSTPTSSTDGSESGTETGTQQAPQPVKDGVEDPADDSGAEPEPTPPPSEDPATVEPAEPEPSPEPEPAPEPSAEPVPSSPEVQQLDTATTDQAAG